MAIYGKLHTDGSLTDIGIRPQASYGDGSTDVVLVSMPSFVGAMTYDSVNQVAKVGTSVPAVAVQKAAATVYVPPRGALTGFRLTWASTAIVNVGEDSSSDYPRGLCRDSTNTIDMFTTGGALSTTGAITVTTDGAANGNDSFIGAGTVTVANAATAVTGTSTAFLTSFGLRLGNGTISSSAGAVTGVGTFFLSRLAVGDLIGNATSGYFQVTAIASNTACTIISTPGTPFSTSAYSIVENPTIKIGSNSVSQVRAIASDTALTLASNSSAAQTGVAYSIGCCPNLGTMPTTNTAWMYVWLGCGSTASQGAAVFVSTQRTTPFSTSSPFDVNSYGAAFRRIGTILINAGSIVPFTQYGDDRNRWYEYEVAVGTSYLRALNGGTATTWTAVVCSAMAPPTSVAIAARFTLSTSVGNFCSLRPRGKGDAATSRNNAMNCAAAGGSNGIVVAACDGAQVIDYANSNSLLQTFIDIYGYQEIL